MVGTRSGRGSTPAPNNRAKFIPGLSVRVSFDSEITVKRNTYYCIAHIYYSLDVHCCNGFKKLMYHLHQRCKITKDRYINFLPQIAQIRYIVVHKK